MVPWVATTAASKTTLSALVKGATDYPCQGERHGGGKRGGRIRERRWERRERAGRGGTRKGTAKVEAGASGEGSKGRGEKRSPLVRDVQTYGTAYKWDGAD